MAKLNKTPLTIRSKRGTEAEITSYTGYQLSGEIAYATDTKDFYVSDGSQFNKIASFPFTGSAQIQGLGTTSTTTAFRVENANADEILKVTDDGAVSVSPDYNGGGFSVNSTLGIRSDSPSNAAVKIIRNNNVGYFAMLSYFDGNSVMWQTGTPKSSDNADFAGTEYIIAQSSRSSPAITINTSDNVGIGSTNPTEKLTVEGNISASGDLAIQGFPSVSASLASAGGGGSAFPFTGSAQIQGLGTTSATTAFRVENSNGDDNFIVRDDGNVGINITSPQARLHIYDDSQSGVFICESSGSVASRDVFKVNSLNNNTDNTKIFTIQKAGVSEFEFRGNGIAVLGLDYANRITTSNPRLSIGDITGQRDLVLGVKTGKSYNSNSPRKITAFYTKLNEEVASFDDHGRLILQKRGLSAPSDGNPYRLTVSGSARITEGLTVTGSISASGDLAIQGFPSVSASLASAGGGGSAFPFTGSAQIQGLGTTSSTTAFRVENANADEILKVTDDGALDMPTLSSGSNIGLVKRDGDAFFYRFSYGNNGTTTPLGRNIFIGKNTGNFTVGATATANYMGSDNIGVGDNALTNLTTGNRNIAIGQGVGASITTAGSNVMMGWGTGNSITTGGENFLLGNFTGGSLTTHKGNVMIGTTVAQNIQGFYNVAIGDRALQGSGTNQSAGNNIAIGRGALQLIKAFSDSNVAIGSQALKNIGGNADGNIAIGYETGINNSGSAFDYNILIGYNVQAPLQNTGNQLNIGNLLYGTGVTSDQSVSTAGKIGIGQTSPDAKLHITGEGTTSGTSALKIENATPTTIFDLKDNGQFTVGPSNDSISIASNGRVTIAASAPDLSIGGGNYLDFPGGAGTIDGLRTINRTGEIRINATQGVRFGSTANSAGTRVSIVGDNNTTPFGIQQTPGGTTNNILATFISGSGDVVMGITADGGFTATDSTLIKRYVFEHGYAPSPADGMGIGLDLKVENASGIITSVGFIDVIQDDISADENSMRLSVGETTPTEVMRLESSGNVGIGTTSPTSLLHLSGSAGTQFRIEKPFTPSGTADTTGATGDWSWDDDYIYVKTSAGWKRSTLSTF